MLGNSKYVSDAILFLIDDRKEGFSKRVHFRDRAIVVSKDLLCYLAYSVIAFG